MKELKFVCSRCNSEFEITDLEELIEYQEEYQIEMNDILEWDNPDNASKIECLPCLRIDDEWDTGTTYLDENDNELVSLIEKHQMELNAQEEDDGPDFWTAEIKMLDECSTAPKVIPIILKPLVKMKMDKLMEIYPNIEWLGYFTGNVIDDKYVVDDLLIPEQTVSTGSVTNIHFSVPMGVSVIGVAHSHHTMGSFFSGTDKEFINSNHNMSIVVSRNDMKGQVRWKAPCGGYKIVDADIKFDFGVDWNVDEFEKEAKEKIKSNSSIVYMTSNQIEIFEEKQKYYNPSYKKEKFNPSKNRCRVIDKRLPNILRGQNKNTMDNWDTGKETLEHDILNMGG